MKKPMLFLILCLSLLIISCEEEPKMPILRISDGRSSFFQWDLNQTLVVENANNCDRVHFTNSSRDMAIVAEIKTYENGIRYVNVPNSLLTVPLDIEAYLYSSGEQCQLTVCKYVFKVIERAKPENYVYTEDEHKDFDQLLSEMENNLTEMEKNLELTKQYRDEAKATDVGTLTDDVNDLKGDLDTERNARIEADSDHSTRIQKNRYEIDNLKAKAEGKLYRTETVEAESYALDVPLSVAPYAEVQKIGGKSVVWNQLAIVYPFSERSGVTTSIDGNYSILNGTATSDFGAVGWWIKSDDSFMLKNNAIGHKLLFSTKIASGSYNGEARFGTLNYKAQIGQSFITTVSDNSFNINNFISDFYVISGTVFNNLKFSFIIVDLTKMFGSGNEPTIEECKKIFSDDYYPYDAGTIRSFPVRTVRSLNAEGTEIGSMDVSSVTSDLKSVGSVHDEWSNGKKTKRIGSVDLGTLPWGYYNNVFYTGEISDKKRRLETYIGSKSILLCAKYTAINANSNMSCQNGQMYEYAHNSSPLRIVIKNDAYTDANSFKSAMSGVMLYYELETPTESQAEIDNYIKVEGGGTLTFESDDAVHMPVPSTDRFVVDLS